MRHPTAAQRRLLDAIVAAQREHGYTPSVRELAATLGVRSTTSIMQHLRALEERGWIRRPAGKARAIEVLT